MNRFKEALDLQNACNISGVVRDLGRIIDNVFRSPDYTGTNSIIFDPAVRMVVHKLADMCQLLGQPFTDYTRMHDACVKRAELPTPLDLLITKLEGKPIEEQFEIIRAACNAEPTIMADKRIEEWCRRNSSYLNKIALAERNNNPRSK